MEQCMDYKLKNGANETVIVKYVLGGNIYLSDEKEEKSEKLNSSHRALLEALIDRYPNPISIEEEIPGVSQLPKTRTELNQKVYFLLGHKQRKGKRRDERYYLIDSKDNSETKKTEYNLFAKPEPIESSETDPKVSGSEKGVTVTHEDLENIFGNKKDKDDLKNKQGKKDKKSQKDTDKQSKRFYVLISLAALLLCLLILVFIKSFHKEPKLDAINVGDATQAATIKEIYNAAFDSHDYKTAAREFDSKANSATNSNEYNIYTAYSAYMYLEQAIAEPDNAETYTYQALVIANKVKKNADKDSWSYLFANTIECGCYSIQNIPSNDERWEHPISIIQQLVDTASPDTDDENEILLFWNSNYVLADYYTRRSHEAEDMQKMYLYSKNIVKYEQQYIELTKWILDDAGLHVDEIIDKHLINSYEASMVCMLENPSKESIQELDEIIAQCEEVLDNIVYSDQTKDRFISFKLIIAKAYFLKSVIFVKHNDLEDAEKNLTACKDTVALLFSLPDVTNINSVAALHSVSPYMFYGDYTTEDAINYYHNEITYLTSKQFSDYDILRKVDIQALICSICIKILDELGPIEDIHSLGLLCSKDLMMYSMTFEDIIEPDVLEDIKAFKQFFDEYSDNKD